MAAKLLLLSVVIALVVLPLLTARDKSSRRGLQKTLLFMLLFNLLYFLAVRYIYPRLL